MKKVLLLYGGNSNEHEVSCRSIINIVNNIDKRLFKPTVVYIQRDNNWYIVDDYYKRVKEVKNIINFIKKYDCVFNIIHGKDGEDGKLQGLFEIYGVKYVGPNSVSSMLCMNKDLTKLLLRINNIPIVPYTDLNNIQYPVIVKPANGGSSIGINKANSDLELTKYVEIAKCYDNNIIIEQFIKARELECAVIEIDDSIHVSSIGEIIPANDFYDYDAKYNSDSSQIIIPANVNDNIVNKIKDYALEVFKILRCRGLARVDFFYDEENNHIYVNEINTLPGFTDISMFSKLLNYDGFTTKEIITLLINEA